MTIVPAPMPALRWRHSAVVSTVVGLLLIAVAVVLLVQSEAVRVVEAQLMQTVISPLLHGETSASGPRVFIGIGTGHVAGLTITGLCSTVVLVVPLLILAGGMLLLPRFRVPRVLYALTVGMVLVTACNFARYAMAGYAYQQGGMAAFDLVHRYIGSLLVIVGFVVAFIVVIVLSLGRRRRPRAAQ